MNTKARIASLSVIASLVASLFVSNAFAQNVPASGKKSIVRCLVKNGRSYKGMVGVELGSDQDSIRLLDLQTDTEVLIRKDQLKSKLLLTDQQAVNYLGLARYLAWNLQQINLSAPNPKVGKIAAVGDAGIYFNRGTKQGVTKGELFNVFRGNSEIKDPETGEVLGTARRKIGQIEITEVHEKLATAKLLGKADLKVGDEVEPTKKSQGIAVMPFLDRKGKIVKSSAETTDETVALLNKLGMKVIDKTKLRSVLDKQAKQQSGVFDDSTIRKVGGLVEARSVLVGSIIPSGSRMKVRVRLLDVATGKVQYTLAVDTPRASYRKGWLTLFPFVRPESNARYEDGENRIKPARELKFQADGKGIGHRIGDFQVNGILRVEKGQLNGIKHSSAAIRIENRDDLDNFDLELVAHCGGYGGFFMMVGWKDGSGYLIEHTQLKTKGHALWHLLEIKNGKFVKDLGEFNRGYRWYGTQTMLLTIDDNHLSISIGGVALLKKQKLENYQASEILIGTFQATYGGKDLLIKSVKLKSR